MKDTVKPKFKGIVENGQLKLRDRPGFTKYLQTLKGDVYLSVDKPRKHRTNPQNAYYWGVVIPLMAEHMGYTHEEMHEALKLKFLLKEGKLPTLRSTATLSTLEFINYLEQVIRLAAEYGVVIPDPDSVEY